MELLRAYRTLKNESARRDYDLVYLSLRRKTALSDEHARESHKSPAPKPSLETESEQAQIAALQKAKQERAAQWLKEEMIHQSSISKIQRRVKRFEQAIDDLAKIAADEAAAEERKNSRSTRIPSRLHEVEESEKVVTEKERARQERRIEKEMTEQRLEAVKARLATAETSMRTSEAKVRTADWKDEMMIQDLHYRIQRREHREQQQRKSAARKVREEQMRKQQEDWEKAQREAKEPWWKQQQADRIAEQIHLKEEPKRWEEHLADLEAWHERAAPRRANCCHGGWWPKVETRAACPECDQVWNFLLECPECSMRACAKCQAEVRPTYQYQGKTHKRRAQPRVPVPNSGYGFEWD
jgi:hypothetical protein